MIVPVNTNEVNLIIISIVDRMQESLSDLRLENMVHRVITTKIKLKKIRITLETNALLLLVITIVRM